MRPRRCQEGAPCLLQPLATHEAAATREPTRDADRVAELIRPEEPEAVRRQVQDNVSAVVALVLIRRSGPLTGNGIACGSAAGGCIRPTAPDLRASSRLWMRWIARRPWMPGRPT
jgi:hypothetical protein